MTIRLIQLVCGLTLIASSLTAQTSDSLIYAEGAIYNAATREPVTARITYQSLPYGNKIGVINNSNYSFPMFDGEKYAITVEADGFAPAKYMLDPAQANVQKKVVQDIELSNGTAVAPSHPIGEVLRLSNLIFEVGKSRIDPESYTELDLVLNMMNENPKMIVGYLASKGVQRSRLKTKAFGGAQPLSRDNTPEAHRLNRRVEVRILQN
jgi:OmpA-OmpF porin, OOP family